MTQPQLLREMADLTEQLEAAQAEIARLKAELEAERSKLLNNDMKQLLNPDEAGRLIGRSVSYLFKDRSSKEPLIPFVKLGPKTIRYRRHDLQKFIESKKQPGRLRLVA